MKISKLPFALAAVLALTPLVAYAQQFANLARDSNLRAGPSRDYPVVAELPAGFSVWVDGCINGYRWCDVTVGPDRGWVYAGNIIYPYQGARVPLLNYGAVIGIGIIAFSLGDYWDNHYRTRPWYPQRQIWIDRPRPVLRPEADHVRPIPVRPPNRPDGMHRPPSGQTPKYVQHPPLWPPAPGQLPPRSRPAGANPTAPQLVTPDHAQRLPQTQVPAKTPRPPQSQAPNEAQRPLQGQPQKEAQRSLQSQPQRETQSPPQGQSRGGDKHRPWEERPEGGKK